MFQENTLNSLITRVESCFEIKLKWRNDHIKECANLVLELLRNQSPKNTQEKLLQIQGVLPPSLFHTLRHIWRIKLVDLCSEQEKCIRTTDEITAFMLSDEFNSWMAVRRNELSDIGATHSQHELWIFRFSQPLALPSENPKSFMTRDVEWEKRWTHGLETAAMLNTLMYQLTTVAIALDKGQPDVQCLSDFEHYKQNNYAVDSGFDWDLLFYWAINQR